MRKIIIDTDGGGDDAAAVLLALAEPTVAVLGITTVFGNVSMVQATQNVLETVRIAGAHVPVIPGAATPLVRSPLRFGSVYGADGMGDCGLIPPAPLPDAASAAEFICRCARQCPDALEIVSLAPTTNLALALRTDPEAMRRVKHIWSMGTAGFGPGNATPVAEFNVFLDAEAYDALLRSGIPLTVAGFDLCLGAAALTDDDLARLRTTRRGRFVADATGQLRRFNEARTGTPYVDLPDAVAMAAALDPTLIRSQTDCDCYCCLHEPPAYGQVILHETGKWYEGLGRIDGRNAAVIRAVDPDRFKRRLMHALTDEPILSPKKEAVL